MAKIFLFRNTSEKLKFGMDKEDNQELTSIILDKNVHNEFIDEVDPQEKDAFKDLFVVMM